MLTDCKLPENWLLTKLSKIFDIKGGGTPSTQIPEYWDGDIPWITSADIHGLTDIKPKRYVSQEGINKSATKIIPKNSVIVVTRVGLGKIALTRTPLCIN